MTAPEAVCRWITVTHRKHLGANTLNETPETRQGWRVSRKKGMGGAFFPGQD